VPSAKADSVCSTHALPAVTRWANEYRRSAAVALFVPEWAYAIEFRNSLFGNGYRRTPYLPPHQLFAGTPAQGLGSPSCCRIGSNRTCVWTGYTGGGFSEKGKPLHKPSEAQPSSPVSATSWLVSGFHGLRFYLVHYTACFAGRQAAARARRVRGVGEGSSRGS